MKTVCLIKITNLTLPSLVSTINEDKRRLRKQKLIKETINELILNKKFETSVYRIRTGFRVNCGRQR